MPTDSLILMPAFNEGPVIADVIRGVRREDGDADVLVVDDGSSDDTAARAQGAGACVVRHPVNLSYGCALRTGYRYALAHGYANVIQIDADGQHDAASIPTVRRALEEGADLVLGSRFLDARSYCPPWTRRVGISVFNLIVRWAIGCPITDVTTGFQGLSQRLVRFHATAPHFPHDFPDANLIIRVARAGFRIVEVPARMHSAERSGGMHAGWRPLWYAYKMGVAVTVEASRRMPRGES